MNLWNSVTKKKSKVGNLKRDFIKVLTLITYSKKYNHK